jgi:hypothetical protein
MPEIKVQRDLKIILSLTENEAKHLAGFLLEANHPNNEVLTAIEQDLAASLDDACLPNYERNTESGWTELGADQS